MFIKGTVSRGLQPTIDSSDKGNNFVLDLNMPSMTLNKVPPNCFGLSRGK
jgi:hypothetical protein